MAPNLVRVQSTYKNTKDSLISYICHSTNSHCHCPSPSVTVVAGTGVEMAVGVFSRTVPIPALPGVSLRPVPVYLRITRSVPISPACSYLPITSVPISPACSYLPIATVPIPRPVPTSPLPLFLSPRPVPTSPLPLFLSPGLFLSLIHI